MTAAYQSRKVTPAIRRRIIEMREAGATLDKISLTLKVARHSVRQTVEGAGMYVRRSASKVPVTPEMMAEAIREYEGGRSFNYVARHILHKKDADAAALMREAGVTLRPFRGNGRGEWRNPNPPPFSASEAALCRAVLHNGVSLRGAVKLYGRGISERDAERLVERFRSEGVIL